jgi:hypothetical protein
VILKKLSMIRISHHMDNVHFGWFLYKVVIKLADYPEYDAVFECNK